MSTSSSESRSIHFNLRNSLRLLGTFSLRRSFRLLGKSAMSLVHRSSRTGKRRERAHSGESAMSGPVTYCGRGPRGRRNSVASFMRWGRKVDAEQFRDNYVYYDRIDKKVYINSSGDTDTWEDRSIGCMWVAVYGMKSICVACRGDVEVDRFPMTTQKSYVRRLFALNVFSEIEDIAKSNKDSRQTLDKPVKRPFAVVSLIPSTTNVHQESGDEASGAVKYLKERMKSGLAFTRIEAIQTAISALQHQCNREFTYTDIWVCVLEEDDETCLMREQVEKHLTEINKPKPLQTNEIEERASTTMEAPLKTNEIEEGAAPLQVNEIEERASTTMEAPLQTTTTVEVPSQTNEIE